MKNVNIEIKARIGDSAEIRAFLEKHHADFKGRDHQIDTYFNVPEGRLKIREGNVEACIVHYHRPNDSGPKRCDYTIEKFSPKDLHLDGLKRLLTDSLGVLCVVDKLRDIYFLDNCKFHIDSVEGLGEFFEIEAIGDENHGIEDLRHQCKDYLTHLGITDDMLVKVSYSDMMLMK